MSTKVFVFTMCFLKAFGNLQNCQDLQTRTVCKLNESYVSYEPAKPHPLKTEVYFDIIKVADLDETSNTMTIFVKLWVLWNDTRLTISNLEWAITTDHYQRDLVDDFLHSRKIQSEWVIVPKTLRDDLFFPNIGFFNTKEIHKQLDYGVGKPKYFWMKHPSHLEFHETLKVESYCQFDFQSFPFDSHECELLVASDVIGVKRILLSKPAISYKGSNISKDLIQINSEKTLPFEIVAESMNPFHNLANGYNYSATGIKLYFKRNSLGLLNGQFYGPTAIFSMLSMLSFCISIEMASTIKIKNRRCFLNYKSNSFTLGSWKNWNAFNTTFDIGQCLQ